MSNLVYIVVEDAYRYGTSVEGVHSDLDRARAEVEELAYAMMEEYHMDENHPDDAPFITWGDDRSYCNIENVGSVHIVDRVVDYVE